MNTKISDIIDVKAIQEQVEQAIKELERLSEQAEKTVKHVRSVIDGLIRKPE
jgi:cell division protein FtsB